MDKQNGRHHRANSFAKCLNQLIKKKGKEKPTLSISYFNYHYSNETWLLIFQTKNVLSLATFVDGNLKIYHIYRLSDGRTDIRTDKPLVIKKYVLACFAFPISNSYLKYSYDKNWFKISNFLRAVPIHAKYSYMFYVNKIGESLKLYME